MELYIAILFVIVLLVAWVTHTIDKANEKDILSPDLQHPKKDEEKL